MERLNANVGAFEGALQQAPEVLEAVGMNPTANIGNGMVKDFMLVPFGKPIVGLQGISIDRRAFSNVFFDARNKC